MDTIPEYLTIDYCTHKLEHVLIQKRERIKYQRQEIVDLIENAIEPKDGKPQKVIVTFKFNEELDDVDIKLLLDEFICKGFNIYRAVSDFPYELLDIITLRTNTLLCNFAKKTYMIKFI